MRSFNKYNNWATADNNEMVSIVAHYSMTPRLGVTIQVTSYSREVPTEKGRVGTGVVPQICFNDCLILLSTTMGEGYA